jgi:hypothetical protein
LPGAGINFIFTCLQALDIYLLAKQALIFTYFSYNAMEFDTIRVMFKVPSTQKANCDL